MKNKLLTNFKFIILFLVSFLLITNCEQDSEIANNPEQNNENQQSRFKVSVINYQTIENENKVLQKLNSISSKNNSSTSLKKYYETNLGFKIILEYVNYMEDTQTGKHSYSFPILRDSFVTSNLENLLIQSNNNGGYDAYIVQYSFSANEYRELNQKSIEKLRTSIKPIDLDISSFNNGTFSKMEYGCTETWEWGIIDHGDEGELVGAGNEDPWEAGWILTGLSCGYSDDGSGNSGGTSGDGNSTSGGGDSGYIAAPNTQLYESYNFDFKNFESGHLTPEQRSYYNLNSNIKSTIDWHLINQNFSGLAMLNATEAISFGESLNLNFQQFNWAFNNRTSQDLMDIKNYLNEEIVPFNPNVENFVKEVIDSEIETNNDAEVDFDDQIINTLTGKALCIYEKLESSSTGFKNAIKKFDGKFPVSHLKFEIDPSMSSNTKRAFTRAPENYVIDIVLNGNPTKDAGYQKRPNLLVAKTIIHEVIHAEMFRKLLSLANSNGSINVSLVNQMLQQGDYPGMLDYYFRNGEDINSSWQHQQMAAHYRETIGRVLQEFDTGIAVPDNQQPSQLYMDLAWEGLNHSNLLAWQQAITQTERDRINQVINNYISQHSNQNCTE